MHKLWYAEIQQQLNLYICVYVCVLSIIRSEKPLQNLKGSRTVYTTKLYGPLAYKGQVTNIKYDEMKSDSPWPLRNDKVFDPLNAFMERYCTHELLSNFGTSLNKLANKFYAISFWLVTFVK